MKDDTERHHKHEQDHKNKKNVGENFYQHLHTDPRKKMAPPAGLEPTTTRLTVEGSTIELQWIILDYILSRYCCQEASTLFVNAVPSHNRYIDIVANQPHQ